MNNLDKAKISLSSIKKKEGKQHKDLVYQAKWIYEKYKYLELLEPYLWQNVSQGSKNVAQYIFQQVSKGEYVMALYQSERLLNYILLGSLDIGEENERYADVFIKYQEELIDFEFNPVSIVNRLEELIADLKAV